jgi:hypothetical protein
MLRNKNSSIPDLRKKTSLIDLKSVNLTACILVIFILTVLIISILCVAAAPNSNIPASI